MKQVEPTDEETVMSDALWIPLGNAVAYGEMSGRWAYGRLGWSTWEDMTFPAADEEYV